MQGEINGPILGIDTITTIKGTKSAVVRVMKIHIDAENIDWAQTPEPNPDIAMVAFSQLFYLPLELGTRVTISGPVQLRQALPPSAEKQLQAQVQKANNRLKQTLRQWLKRNHYDALSTEINTLLARFLSEQLNLKDFYQELQTVLLDSDENPTPHIDKLRHAMHPLLESRWQLTRDAPTVLWFEQAENIEMQDSLEETDDGPLGVIRLDQGSLEEKWAQWLAKMKATK
jgi:hypothetical protein